ncbi:hypothetical protein ACI780_01175 [Geodermatophilus sp. SYSU D00814]
MDPAAPIAAWGVLAAALPALVAVAVLLARTPPPTRTAPDSPRDAPPPDAARHWAHDDLPGFLEAPPGTPARPVPARAEPLAETEEEPVTRAVAGLAAAALALVAVLAGVALVTGRAGESPTATAPTAAVPSPSAPAPAPRTPDLPPVPADPLSGERGAGLLAARSVPLGDDGTSARAAFGGLVLEHRAVGVTVAYPAVSVTVGEDGTALAHVRLPTWNCLGTTAPDDPADAGCTPTGTEYADLPTPALGVTRDGDALRVAGRFPTYTRPAGTPPAYTGRVYDLSVTVAPAAPLEDGEAPAEGTVFLGTERAESLADPLLSRVRVAG